MTIIRASTRLELIQQLREIISDNEFVRGSVRYRKGRQMTGIVWTRRNSFRIYIYDVESDRRVRVDPSKISEVEIIEI